MYFNFLFVPTILSALILFLFGRRISRVPRSATQLAAWFILAALLAVPALLFVIYYGRVLDRSAWFYEFRALPDSELTASGLGFGGGLLTGSFQCFGTVKAFGWRTLLSPIVGLLCCVVLAVPYIKPLIAPIRTPIHDSWSQGVCLQTSSSTCGPSSAATLLRQFNILASERELAQECFSYRGGTENWYVARALQRHGLQTRYLIISPEPTTLLFPSMAGVQMGGARYGGHFITILGRQNDSYIIGDPLVGRLVLTPEQLRTKYYFIGFFLLVSHP